MYWPARRREAYNVAAIYRAHPMFADAKFEFWYPARWATTAGSDVVDFGRASMEGGDVMPIGNGTVLIGMSERTQGRMIEQIAQAMFAEARRSGSSRAVMSRDRAHMHLDTVFTLLDRDKATAYPKVVNEHPRHQPAARARPGDFHVTVEDDFLAAVADALGVDKLQVVETGGDEYQQEREQWDDGNNVVALEPGVVVAYERNTYTIAKMREAGVEVVEIAGLRAGQGPRRRSLHDVPAVGTAMPVYGGADHDDTTRPTTKPSDVGAHGPTIARFGLPQAIALIMGSIIGVGIFNLPTSLAGYGPITLVSMGADDRRRAGAGAAVRRAVAAAAGRRRTVRVRAGRVRQPARLRQRVVVLDHRLGRQRRDRRRLGAVRRGVRQQGPQPARLGPARARRPVDPGGDQPVRREEHGLGPGRRPRSSSSPRWRSCRPSACSTSRRANFTPWNVSGESAIAAIGGGMAIALFSYLGVEVAAVAAAKVRDPDRNIPRATIFGTLADRGRLHALADGGLRHPARPRSWRSRPRRSPTPPTRCSAAPGPAT